MNKCFSLWFVCAASAIHQARMKLQAAGKDLAHQAL